MAPMVVTVFVFLCLFSISSASNLKVPHKDVVSGSLYDVINEEAEAILYSLVRQAGLSDLLAKPGNLTLFGPTDDAFLELPENVRTELSTDNTTLESVLSYHIINESVLIENVLVNDHQLKTLNGQPLRINLYKNNTIVTLSGKRLNLDFVDIRATNGIFNIIDDVMFPPIGDVAYTASQDQQLKTFTTLIMEAGIYPNLTATGPFTIFAPTDVTFSKLPMGAIDKLLQDIPALTEILSYHIVVGTYYREGFTNETLKTLNGHMLPITEGLDGIKVNGAKFVTFDETATNGVIHAIDSVLQPPSFRQIMHH